MVQPVFLAFGLFLTLVKETQRRKEHVLWGPGVQVPAEMGSAQKGSGLEWRQGCWVCSLRFCIPCWGSLIDQEHRPAFHESLAEERGLTVVSLSVSVTSQRPCLCPPSIDNVHLGSRQWPT